MNEDKELMCLEIYGVRYNKLTTHEKHIIDVLYQKLYNLKGGIYGKENN